MGGVFVVLGNFYYGGGGDGFEGRIRIDYVGIIIGSGIVVFVVGVIYMIFGLIN